MSNKDYLKLLDFWFGENKDYWFGCPKIIDIKIKNKYQKLLNIQVEENYDSNNLIIDKHIILSKIILCDQISRHIYRDNKEEINKYDKISLNIIEKSKILSIIEDFNPEERCFLLLPYRHTFNESYLKICIDYITLWRHVKDQSIYKRFYQATIKALSKIYNNKELLYSSTINYSDLDILNILDKKSINNINSFNICNINDKNNLYDIFSNNIPKNYSGNLIVSISGGVDSMICLFLLKKLSIENKNILPIAVSINYKNRLQQDIEIYMVNKICNILEIPHYVRQIEEIQRTRDCDRSFYENITREIRFDCYSSLGGSVILGHNLDDSLENIFSNIKKKKNYDNLFGMEINSIEKNVNIVRPLLNIPKKNIIEYANVNNIPYIYDSTPSWCERGLLRDTFIPFIENFDKNILYGLIELSNNYKEIYKIYEKTIPKIEYYEKYCIVENNNIFFFDYWKKILTIISNKYNYTFVKNKSIYHMIKRFKENNNKRITLSKNIIMQINNNIYFYFTH